MTLLLDCHVVTPALKKQSKLTKQNQMLEKELTR